MRNDLKQGFLLVCNNCGKKINLLQSKDDCGINYIETVGDEIKVEIDWGYQETEISCQCGNRIISGFEY